jgi:hypothetical protein
MGMFGTKKIVCPKNEWTTIISSSFAQMPVSWRIKFVPESGGVLVDGIYSEKRFMWVFPQAPTEGRLEAEMIFNRYWINTFYSLKICPAVDLIAEID